MTDDDIRAHVMKAEGVLDEIQDKVTGQFGEARKAIMAIDRAYSQLLDSRDFYREARNELITDRDHWEAQAKEARAQGVSDLINRHRLENQVRNREAERDELKAERDDLQRRFEFLQNDFNQFYLEHRDGTPRIITAEELREGQVVIEYFWDLSANYGHIVSLHADEGVGHATIRTEDGELEATAFGGPGATIVLLADAPTSDGPPAPRLTANDLDAAPAGSVVSEANRHWIKTTINGTWFRVTRFGQAEKRTSEELLAMGLGDATLHHPERGDHE